MRDYIVVVERDRAPALHCQSTRDEGVVLDDSRWNSAGGIIEVPAFKMKRRPKYPILALTSLQVAGGAGEGIRRRGRKPLGGSVGNILPFAVPIGLVRRSEALFLSHGENSRCSSGVFLESALLVQDGVSGGVLERGPGLH